MGSSAEGFEIERPTNMKHFAFLILATALFVNITWADPNENGLLARFKRARRLPTTILMIRNVKFRVTGTLPTAMKEYALQQTVAFTKGKTFGRLDKPDSGTLSTKIQNAMKKKFRGNWFVMGCEADEYCSLTHIGKYVQFKVTNGQSVWFYVAKY